MFAHVCNAYRRQLAVGSWQLAVDSREMESFVNQAFSTRNSQPATRSLFLVN